MVILARSPLSPVLHSKKNKRGWEFIAIFSPYQCFLCTSIMTAPMIAMKTNRPAIAGTKYRSATDSGGASVGAGVAAASSTANAASAEEPAYTAVSVIRGDFPYLPHIWRRAASADQTRDGIHSLFR